MKKVVFIDRGNILRSPIAKAIYNSIKAGDSFAVAYGTNVVEQGNQDLLLSGYKGIADTISVLNNHQLDISNEKCTQLLPEHLNNVSKIIVMTEKVDIPGWLNKYNYEYWGISNPEIVTKEVAEEIFSLLKDKVEDLISRTS